MPKYQIKDLSKYCESIFKHKLYLPFKKITQNNIRHANNHMLSKQQHITYTYTHTHTYIFQYKEFKT